MNEQDWIAAMEAEPACVRTMLAFSDWLQDRDDERWIPLAWLAERGKVGQRWRTCGYWCHISGMHGDECMVPTEWWGVAHRALDESRLAAPVAMRLALMSTHKPTYTSGD